MKLARGTYQEYLLYKLETFGYLDHPRFHLKGKARNLYLYKYITSYRHLVERLRKAGYVLEYEPGPRGGEYMSKYILVSRPLA